ncbi:ATP-dependent RNA helicase SUV3 homolog, mitochondrial-like isoform X2 [Physella acuta]|uniref:ATP-dependent RNA helicase SUV3 homolog, mitochondrial-like isoform X2 n=1 Tax=Physella acuta TaxID=109671 RepID=UPI0027DD35FA|nr:ATP-dependent RNA helicase SUV3 homolog, mitochondrial-like isoform X2 [Physella acuta]
MACRLSSYGLEHSSFINGLIGSMLRKSCPVLTHIKVRTHMCRRFKSKKSKDTLSSVIQPITIKPATKNADDINIGEELTGTIRKENLVKLLSQFHSREEVKKLAFMNGLDNNLFYKAFLSFREFCIKSEQLPVDLHIVFSDILQGSGHVDDIFPYFLKHSYEMFPHLESMEDLKKISDLRYPANWYPEARSIQRKFIFHAGPTNSGKTFHALEKLIKAESGIYCGPLKLLASEVYHKCNQAGTPCDLVTGEERRFASSDETPSAHVACTVEMASLTTQYDVAVIDEIQMIRDQQRGWAWTRAVLGLYAKEIHVCGEASSIDLIKEIALTTGEEVEVCRYKRLTNLTFLDYPVGKFENVRAGDCIVCFSKNDIYYVTRQLEQLGKECAVIYGSLPPTTKLAQSSKFNDVSSSCKVMVATDAIGMGLNLAIKRVVFYSVMKPMLNEKGEREMDLISTSQALQIAGRAGRFNTAYQHGEVTTFYAKDLNILKDIIQQHIEPITQGGLHPTADQIELFAYHLPKATLSNLIEIFELSCALDKNMFFMCKMDDFKFLADMIQHVPLPLRVRYVFCCAPISVKQPFSCTMFLQFARRFSRNEPLTLDWLCQRLGWPLRAAGNLTELVHLECVFDVLDLYLWLSYRFPDMFPDAGLVRELQCELDLMIQQGVSNLVQLVKSQQSGQMDINEEEFEMKTRSNRGLRKKPLEEEIQSSRLEQKDALRENKAAEKLSQKLIDQGLVDRDTLDKLKAEWKLELEGRLGSDWPKQTGE